MTQTVNIHKNVVALSHLDKRLFHYTEIDPTIAYGNLGFVPIQTFARSDTLRVGRQPCTTIYQLPPGWAALTQFRGLDTWLVYIADESGHTRIVERRNRTGSLIVRQTSNRKSGDIDFRTKPLASIVSCSSTAVLLTNKLRDTNEFDHMGFLKYWNCGWSLTASVGWSLYGISPFKIGTLHLRGAVLL